MSQTLPALEQYHKETEYILGIVDLAWRYIGGRRQGVITKANSQPLEQQITSLLKGLPKKLELVESLPQSDALVVQYGSGVYSICGVHGASVHAAVITLARRLSESLSRWKWLVNRRDASTELDRAKAALKHEIGKVKKQLIPPTAKRAQAEGNGGETAARRPRKRKRKADPKVVERRKQREARQKIEKAICADWQKGEWTDYQDYATWKNEQENLPEGWPKLTRRAVERAVENANRRARYKKK